MVQMPALNTPQFDWVKNRLPRKPQPVPPIYQPEVAAQAIVHAAHHYRREWYVGGSTAVVIAGNKFAPASATGIWARRLRSQQYDGQADPNRPNNLYEPVDEERDHGAHGDFDSRAMWSATRFGWTSAAAGSPSVPSASRGCGCVRVRVHTRAEKALR